MIAVNINHTNYRSLLSDLSSLLNLQYNGEDYLLITPPVGSGIVKTLDLRNNLQVFLSDVTFFEDIITTRPKSNERLYILHFEDIIINEPMRFSVDEEQLQKNNTHHAVARLTSNIFQNIEEIPANVHIKSVKVLLNEDWLRQYLGIDMETTVLQKYLALKTESFDLTRLDAEYVQLMEALWTVQKEEPLHNIFLQNRVSLLVERFFTQLSEKMSLLDKKFDLTDDEINRLAAVEKALISDFSKTPPTIDDCSRMASMSNTMLKKKFKGMYGCSIYSYYQQQRMQKAKELLDSGVYKIKDTAEAVGYLKTSNFITAFKKQYHTNPGRLSQS